MVRVIGFILLGAVLAPAQQYRAFWVDAFHAGFKTPSQVEQLLDDCATARANAVFAEMRRRGDSYYLRSLEPPADDPDYAPTFDALDYLIKRAHARGVEVHAWFPVTPAGTSSNPAHVSQQHGPKAAPADMWMTVSAKGGVSTSLDPGHPAAAQYLANVILEPARWYDLDGLHLDYVRYPEDADYGYNPIAIARFQRLRNKTGAPLATDPDWSAFRRDQVSALVRQIYLRAYTLRPQVKISGSVITWGNGPVTDDDFRRMDAYSRVFQDWRGWLEEGILDMALPMNYFREQQYPTYFNRWIEYEKNHQYGRALVVGPAVYLNSIPDSLAQLTRALAPSATGKTAAGVSFYSYASTNLLDDAGVPIEPNQKFYSAVGNQFATAATVPVLPWRAAPTRGHVLGNLQVAGGADWLNDGADIFIESDTGGESRRTVTDGTGFFGAVDLPPDRYRVRLERGGIELYRSTPQDVAAGAAMRFDIQLTAADFATALPRLTAADAPLAAPGSVIALTGSGLGSIAETQVLVNGTAAALLSVTPTRVVLQLPWTGSAPWTFVARRAGMESQPLAVDYAATNPAIQGLVRQAGYLEIYCTGLGRVSPTPAPGAPATGSEPFSRTVLPVSVRIGATTAEVLYSGLEPLTVGRYQVNVKLPDGVTSGPVRVTAGGVESAPFEMN